MSVRPSARLSLRVLLALTGSVVDLAGSAAEGVGQAGMQGEHAVQAGDAKDAQDQPVGTDQLDATVVVAVSEQAPPGAHQHTKALRIDEADLAKVDHQPSAAGVDRLVQAVA